MYTYSPLLTDFYQLTMAYGYWQLGMHEQEASFNLLFRKNPFKGNYAIACGLSSVIEFLQQWKFTDDDLNYLLSLKDNKGNNFFSKAFIDYLSQLTFNCDLDAIAEGTVVFANEPLLRIQGPLLQCQLLESALLNIINFQTLIATKASRVCRAAAGDQVIEFGLRRAQGPDGALSASKAAYIGGCAATSNTLAGRLYDIPVRGTHAHSWVSAFPSEKIAFEEYAKVMPNNVVLLVDTYNTLQGVANAIEVGKNLRAQGSDLIAIRLDSGDMADLSIKARKLLDTAGFEKTSILASNSLDEYVIQDLKDKNSKITMWGVGTNLVTAYDQAALDGVYKLGALRNIKGEWEYKLKLSEQEIKNSTPGRSQVRRYFANEQFVMDVIYDLELQIAESPQVELLDSSLPKMHLDDSDGFVDLLQPILRRGDLIGNQPSIHDIRNNCINDVSNFYKHHGIEAYPVALEKNLYDLKKNLIIKYRR